MSAELELDTLLVELERTIGLAGNRALRSACVRADLVRLRAGLASADANADLDRLMHYGVFGGPAVLELLAADVRAPLDTPDSAGSTPLMLACDQVHGRSEQLERTTADACAWLLSRGADPSLRDDDGRTALHRAAYADRRQCVDALLDAGAAIDAIDHRGRTPLMLAALDPSGDSEALVEQLLSRGAEPNARDNHGWTALHIVAATNANKGRRRELARLLAAHGGRPCRDRAGRSPADLCARRGLFIDDRGPLDPRCEVDRTPRPLPLAAPPEIEPSLVDRLLDELVPTPSDTPDGNRPRAPLDTWTVLADWLQSHGDARGELVAASLAITRVGGRKRRALRELQRRAAAKAYSLTFFASHCADPIAPLFDPGIVTKSTHGFITTATIPAEFGRWGTRSNIRNVFEAAAALLRFEPLLADLRLRPHNPRDWPALIDLLATLPPTPRLRRLVLVALPRQLPDLEPLVPVFPGLRSLWLLGGPKLESGTVRWPGVSHLRVRHGNSSRSQGLADLTLDLPDLTHLDLALPPGAPIGGHSDEAEIAGTLATLQRIGDLPHLRLSRLSHWSPSLATAIFERDLFTRLRSLELAGVRGATLEVLIEHAEHLRGIERIRVSPAVTEDLEHGLAQLREALPQLEIDRRVRLRRRGPRPSMWAP